MHMDNRIVSIKTSLNKGPHLSPHILPGEKSGIQRLIMPKLSSGTVRAGLNDESLVKVHEAMLIARSRLQRNAAQVIHEAIDRAAYIYSLANTSINHLDRTKEKFLGEALVPPVCGLRRAKGWKKGPDLPLDLCCRCETIFFFPSISPGAGAGEERGLNTVTVRIPWFRLSGIFEMSPICAARAYQTLQIFD